MLTPAFRRSLLPVLLLCAVPLGGRATAIHYEIADLTDTTPGEDLWQYRYDLSGFSGGEFGFDIYFPLSGGFQPSDLSNPTSPNGDWDVLVIQPDPGIPADGFFDAARLAAPPLLPATYFSADFIWHGPGVPGSQRAGQPGLRDLRRL